MSEGHTRAHTQRPRRIISYLLSDLTLDCGVHTVLTGVYTRPFMTVRGSSAALAGILACLHSCSGSERDVPTLSFISDT